MELFNQGKNFVPGTQPWGCNGGAKFLGEPGRNEIQNFLVLSPLPYKLNSKRHSTKERKVFYMEKSSFQNFQDFQNSRPKKGWFSHFGPLGT